MPSKRNHCSQHLHADCTQAKLAAGTRRELNEVRITLQSRAETAEDGKASAESEVARLKERLADQEKAAAQYREELSSAQRKLELDATSFRAEIAKYEHLVKLRQVTTTLAAIVLPNSMAYWVT